MTTSELVQMVAFPIKLVVGGESVYDPRVKCAQCGFVPTGYEWSAWKGLGPELFCFPSCDKEKPWQ